MPEGSEGSIPQKTKRTPPTTNKGEKTTRGATEKSGIKIKGNGGVIAPIKRPKVENRKAAERCEGGKKGKNDAETNEGLVLKSQRGGKGRKTTRSVEFWS